ncbi:MAG TPA: hypothetical protein VGO58_12555 [Chitinophagaceae bacterium]|nr:hypothetical protein [Chitinophagaceae bacterium]
MNYKKPYRNGPVQLKDGFYIEVCDFGKVKGMKIRSDNKKSMEAAASQYADYKTVIILGEYKSGVPLSEMPIF